MGDENRGISSSSIILTILSDLLCGSGQISGQLLYKSTAVRMYLNQQLIQDRVLINLVPTSVLEIPGRPSVVKELCFSSEI